MATLSPTGSSTLPAVWAGRWRRKMIRAVIKRKNDLKDFLKSLIHFSAPVLLLKLVFLYNLSIGTGGFPIGGFMTPQQESVAFKWFMVGFLLIAATVVVAGTVWVSAKDAGWCESLSGKLADICYRR
jgi:hypothetical protein